MADDSPTAENGVPGLRCPACHRTYEATPEEPWRCRCGGPLEIDADPDLPSTPPAGLDRDRGLWAFARWLPVSPRVTLGEGWTPMVDAPGFDCAFKLEYVFPSGSFKDRGATAALSRAAGLGVDRVLEDSSGNAGAAMALYAARAGVDARIFVPVDAKPAKVSAIDRTGAEVVRVEGDRQAVTDACIEAVEGAEPRSAETTSGQRPRGQGGDGWYASHAHNPAFYAGTSTFAFEVAAQRDWTAPDALVLPVGHGTLLLGAFRGFRAMCEAGLIDREPRLLTVQAAGVAPVAEAVGGDAASGERDGPDGRNDLADGIQISTPARRDEVLRAVRETDGDAIAVGESATREALDRLRRAGFGVEPTSAAAAAGLDAYRELGVLDGDDVVVPLTGSGLKDI
ncbi:threonine synthase [Halobacteriales archaeon QS_1_68_20]|nr:MAG: threonine synthase [Halobacteriales archaeon QS_1_68_20]